MPCLLSEFFAFDAKAKAELVNLHKRAELMAYRECISIVERKGFCDACSMKIIEEIKRNIATIERSLGNEQRNE